MKYISLIALLILSLVIASCSDNNLADKGFEVNSSSGDSDFSDDGLNHNGAWFETRPSQVLLTGIPNMRLTTIYKINYSKDSTRRFIGSNNFHYQYGDDSHNSGNNWNNNLIPGLQAIYGYNLVNVSLYDVTTNAHENFFEKPVLIKTLYYPTFSNDTLNFQPITRNYSMVSVYNADTNKDGFINLKDLRRLYLFDVHGKFQNALIPENYSVFKSEYDSANDFMYVFAQLDTNANGQRDEKEPVHIFWIDLKDPTKTGQVY